MIIARFCRLSFCFIGGFSVFFREKMKKNAEKFGGNNKTVLYLQ